MPSTRTHFSLAALTTNAPVTAGVMWIYGTERTREEKGGASPSAVHAEATPSGPHSKRTRSRLPNLRAVCRNFRGPATLERFEPEAGAFGSKGNVCAISLDLEGVLAPCGSEMASV